jgi:enoyl-CoA hydratase/carnithine racemase
VLPRPILESTSGHLRTITLNRPAARNALSASMRAELCALLAQADQDPAVHAVILTGTDPAFCAGNDFTDLSQFASEDLSFAAALTMETTVAYNRPFDPNAFAASGRAVARGDDRKRDR